jgi:2-C-methyl-D-erythritol 4-phosphate cytidylyltransferase
MELLAIVPLPTTVQAAAAFAPVAGQAALVRVVRTLVGPVPTSRVIVVADEPLMAGARACLDSAALSVVSVIASGARGTRRQCLETAFEHVDREPHPASHVLVHDVGHPLARLGATERVIAGLRAGHRVVVPVMPMTDTVKAIDERGAVLGTVDRIALRAVQYPRGYARSALAELIGGEDDEFAAAVSAGMSIATVGGDPDAFAAELPADTELLDAINAAHRPA